MFRKCAVDKIEEQNVQAQAKAEAAAAAAAVAEAAEAAAFEQVFILMRIIGMVFKMTRIIDMLIILLLSRFLWQGC